MTRNVPKIAYVTLFFFLLHPATGLSQSQKSQFWQVPALPSQESTSEKSVTEDRVLVPKRHRAEKYRRLLGLADIWSDSAHQLGIGADGLSSARSLQQSLSENGVIVLGSESGVWGGGKISLRSHPGKEPEVSLDGVSLSSGFSGARSDQLIPITAIEEVRIYPFFPEPGSPRRGISGRYELVTKRDAQNFSRETRVLLEQPRAIVAAHRLQLRCDRGRESFLGCSHLSWQWSSRKGPQRVIDDNNTPNNSADDYEGILKHNDLDRSSVLLRTHKKTETGVDLETTSLLGIENKGMNGLPISQSSENNRSHKTLSLFSHSGSSLSLTNGRFWNYRLSGRHEAADFLSSLQNQARQLRSDLRTEKVFSGGLGFSAPVSMNPISTRIFFGGHYEINQFASEFGILDVRSKSNFSLNKKTDLERSLLSGTLSEAQLGGGVELLKTRHTMIRGELYVQSASSLTRQRCGAFAPSILCINQQGKQTKSAPSAALEFQYNFLSQVTFYTLVGQSVRLPSPVELAGRPDGVVANLSLKPESALFFEGGLQTPFAHIGCFIANDSELISMRQVSPYLVKYENSPAVRRYGFFGNADFTLGNWNFSSLYEKTAVRPKETTSMFRIVPFIPSWRGRVSLERTFGAGSREKGMGSLTPSFVITQTGPYALDEQGLTELHPPALLSGALVWNIPSSGQELDVEFKMENLLNSVSSGLKLGSGAERKVAWSYLPVLPIDGRSYILSLRLRTP